ncbi:hypothetical protein LQZ24_02115 [Fructobacillus sp. M1-13]|uniref:Uncharacterized protein n=1 Tax=Fructobacillus papyriferae TaxID=2713171 RepID=A0ABS5QNW6_9LACO|nr:hypothetical protein [Fructobacillus papyriferae]MBS9334834.1 hypothetical protein [Fructobacillus papyriferae]MCD2158824.1 hypothetical protein [Fructobacillus papyriferae]
MKIVNKSNQYLESTAAQYVSTAKPVYSVSTNAEIKYKWKDNKPTNEVSGYQLTFVQEGLPPFNVKFDAEPTVPKFLGKVALEQLEALEIRTNVYFKASSVKEVK